ncbi:protein of unknown function (plasmid) [Caballeronia sp. S22]
MLLQGELAGRSRRIVVDSPGAYCPLLRWIVPVIQMSSCRGKVLTGELAASASFDQKTAAAAAIASAIRRVFMTKTSLLTRFAREHRRVCNDHRRAPGSAPFN